MILALCLIGSVLILGTITVTSAQLARMRLLDAADAAALDAADTVSDVVYVSGVRRGRPLTDAAVVQSASAYLSARRCRADANLDHRPGTGSPDGTSAVVVLTGTAELPIIGSALDAIRRLDHHHRLVPGPRRRGAVTCPPPSGPFELPPTSGRIVGCDCRDTEPAAVLPTGRPTR